MTKKEFMAKYNFNDLDFRNLERYEQVRANGVMNMFEYLALMKAHNLNGGEKLATWISSSNNYKEFIKVLEKEKRKNV